MRGITGEILLISVTEASGSGIGGGGVGVRIMGGATRAGDGSLNFGLIMGDATFAAKSGPPRLTGLRLFLKIGTSSGREPAFRDYMKCKKRLTIRLSNR